MARTFITRHTADEPVDLGTKRLYVNAVIKSNIARRAARSMFETARTSRCRTQRQTRHSP